MLRRRLAILVVTLGALLPLGIHAAQAGPGITPTNHGRHWACVGVIDIDVGVCVDNPVPPPPF
ncbi:MAG: hypothetical protein QOG64_2537 [Acidimicrobiaceae bacterium]|nr:hypothetical protein [Acidimicrobiaceae bacterium]